MSLEELLPLVLVQIDWVYSWAASFFRPSDLDTGGGVFPIWWMTNLAGRILFSFLSSS